MKRGKFYTKNMVSTGKLFENRIRRWHKYLECTTCKWPDHASTGTMQKAWCDRVTLCEGNAFFLECKHTNSKTSFSFSLVKPHQWRNMLKIARHAKAFFLLEDGNKNVYFISALMLKAYFYTYKTSIKFKKLESFIITKNEFQLFLYKGK